jgi:hypothetical protein
MKKITTYMLLTLSGTFSLLACYNHINTPSCPNSYTNGNGGDCTLVIEGTYDDPIDDGTGAKGKDNVKDKNSNSLSGGDCQYNCQGYPDSYYQYGKKITGKDCNNG